MPQSENKYREISIRLGEDVFSASLFLPEYFSQLKPHPADWSLMYQSGEMVSLLLTAMTALARDLYSRYPEGSREFESALKNIVPGFYSKKSGRLVKPEELLKTIESDPLKP